MGLTLPCPADSLSDEKTISTCLVFGRSKVTSNGYGTYSTVQFWSGEGGGLVIDMMESVASLGAEII